MSGYYSQNPHYAPTDFSEMREKYERCEEKAGALFAAATVAQTTLFHLVLRDLRGLSAPRYDRARAAAEAEFKRTTAAASELCEQSMQELMRDGEVSQETYEKWDALDAAGNVGMLQAAE